MKFERLTANAAKKILEKSESELDYKNSLLASKQNNEKKYKKNINDIILKITKSALEGKKFFEIYNNDSDYLIFCFEELSNIGFFDIDIYRKFPGQELDISSIENEIKSIGKSSLENISIQQKKLQNILSLHPEYITTYEWLSEIVKGKPILKSNWYLYDYGKLEIIKTAILDNLINNNELKFQWQKDIKTILLAIEDEHKKSVAKILNLTYDTYEEDYYDENKQGESKYFLNLLGMKIKWNYKNSPTDKHFPNESFDGFCSPNMLTWISSEIGQNFFFCIDKKIKSASKQGLNEIYFKITQCNREKYTWFEDDEKIQTPTPEIIIYLYSLLNFNVEIIRTIKSLNESTYEDNYFFMQISW